MARLKFKIGDKVTITDRCPWELRRRLRRNRTRTILGREYDPKKQCNYFFLGYNFQGASDQMEAYPFRSYMLDPAVKGRKAGRPKTKRRYRRTAK